VVNPEIVLGAAMFVLLLVVALSIALIAWDPQAPPDRDTQMSEPKDLSADK
jgi:hypothetical protein